MTRIQWNNTSLIKTIVAWYVMLVCFICYWIKLNVFPTFWLLHIGSDFVTGRRGGGRDAEDVSELHPVQVLGGPLQRVRVGSKVA